MAASGTWASGTPVLEKKRVDGFKNGRSVDGCVYGFRKCI